MGDPVFYVGRNDDERGLSHGMRGTVSRVMGEAAGMRVAWEDGVARTHDSPHGRTAEMAPAYSLSYHRSQGSQWPAVVVAVTMSAYRVITREALCTAVTRVRREVVVVTEGNALSIALSRRGADRRTALQVFLARHAERGAGLARTAG